MRKWKKVARKMLGVGLSAAMLATTMFTGGVASAEEVTDTLLTNETVTGDATYIGTYMKSNYLGGGRSAFEISFKYNSLGTPAADNTVGFNDTFEFLVFDSAWGGWDKTTVGPNGVDKTAAVTPETDKVYTVTVPFATIEGKLSTTGQANGINLQTGGIGTTSVTITSLKYVAGAEQDSADVLMEGSWHKTGDAEGEDCGTMTVTEGTAFVDANAWNIAVSGINVKTFKKPIVAVTVNYKDITETIYPQAEILDSNYQPLEANYPQVSANGNVTYLTNIDKNMTSMYLAYDTCTVKKVEIYDEAEDFEKPITGLKNNNIISNMGAGWNLGNALDAIKEIKNDDDVVIDAVPDETAWGNPVINKRLFKQVAAAGFKTVRIPVTWISAVDPENNYAVDDAEVKKILDRVQEVVDMAIDYNMFVIINIQHDGGEGVFNKWLDIEASNQTGVRSAFGTIWTKIATRFKDYDQHLIFESMNELKETGHYDPPKKATTWPNINALNALFVEKVRAAGGSNTTRFLLMPGYNTNISATVNAYNDGKFTIPTYNESKQYEMVSVHFYDPYNFTLNTGSGSTTTLTTDEMDNIAAQFVTLYATFVDQGIPVYIGEFGAVDKGNYSEIRQYTEEVVTQAKLYGLGYAYWDNGYTDQYGSALWNRYTYAKTRLGQEIIPVLTAKD